MYLVYYCKVTTYGVAIHNYITTPQFVWLFCFVVQEKTFGFLEKHVDKPKERKHVIKTARHTVCGVIRPFLFQSTSSF